MSKRLVRRSTITKNAAVNNTKRDFMYAKKKGNDRKKEKDVICEEEKFK